jgi:hypothetical protein
MESDSHDSAEQIDYKVLNETRDVYVSKTSGYLPKIVCPAKQDNRVGFVCQVSILENHELDQKPGTHLFTPKMTCLNRDVHSSDFWKDNLNCFFFNMCETRCYKPTMTGDAYWML